MLRKSIKSCPESIKSLRKVYKITICGYCSSGHEDIILHRALQWPPELQAVDAHRQHSLHGTSFKPIAKHKWSTRLQLFEILRVHGVTFLNVGVHPNLVTKPCPDCRILMISKLVSAHGVHICMCSCVFEDCFVEEYASMISFGFCPLALMQ